MQTPSVDIEQIIRVVLQRLATAGDLADGLAKIAAPAESASDLVLHDSLITLSQIDSRLEGKRRLRVSPRAVVTPAVRDLLRQKKIELVRESAQLQLVDKSTNLIVGKETVPPGQAPILVCGSAIWFASLVRHLCPKQATVCGATTDDALALKQAAEHVRLGGQCAVWLTPQPFAAAVAAGRNSDLAAVQLPSLRELSAAIEQAHPQLLILDAAQWTVAAIGNLVRALIRERLSQAKG